MRKFTIWAACVGLMIAGGAVGMTATSWASSPAGPPRVPGIGTQMAAPGPHAVPPVAPAAEAVYKPITPCRIVDTLLGGGALGDGVSRAFYVGGTTGFAPQGGKSGGCGIPVGATAITATITAVRTSEHGYLRAFPNGASEPNATVLSYPKGGSTGTGTTVGIKISSPLALALKNHGGPAHFIIDVTGYYAQQMEGFVKADGTPFSGTPRMVSAARVGAGVYVVGWDTSVDACTPMVNTYSGAGNYGTAYNTSTFTYVYTWSLNPSTHVEVATDHYFYVAVLC